MRPRRSPEGAGARAWTAALLLALATVPACGPPAAGNLYAPGHLGVAGPSQVGRPVGIGGPWLCSNGTGPVRLISIEPVTRVGDLDLRVAVHRIATARPTDLVGGGDEPLPASYGPVSGAEVPACSSDHRLVVGL
ncbi:MAG: hypothetical protein AVDCRST_MAG41-3262 [uncultured Corynebacteriales bacterium]|uniref:Uncharacterized protein n=1 Tax=uncultured Mycobacteriales bacterium TaxID=581187 RepID=A0A6J4JC98_9ACTN|nr:MAG: hypothetical protein AVDCRST_MAG41-3262 [uncultured Corynebacteriales bacterium]